MKRPHSVFLAQISIKLYLVFQPTLSILLNTTGYDSTQYFDQSLDQSPLAISHMASRRIVASDIFPDHKRERKLIQRLKKSCPEVN